MLVRGERLNGIQALSGSIPLISAKKKDTLLVATHKTVSQTETG